MASLFGYIVYDSTVIPDYTFVEIPASDDIEISLYEKKIIADCDIEVKYQNTIYTLKAGIHYFPRIIGENDLLLIPNVVRNRFIRLFQISKPAELVVSKIFKEKQILIDKYMKDIEHSRSISKLFTFYPLFIPTITHKKYKYIFSLYKGEIMYTKYMDLQNDVGASLYHQYFKEGTGYKEERISIMEYKGKIKNEIHDDLEVENILTSLNNTTLVNDPYISQLITSHSFDQNFLKIKYLYKDHGTLRKRLKDEYMLILRPPKFDEFIDLYEPYSDDVIASLWAEHFAKIEKLVDEKHISFVKI